MMKRVTEALSFTGLVLGIGADRSESARDSRRRA